MVIPDEQLRIIGALGIKDEIIHPKFGKGVILEITGDGIDTEFKVTFVKGAKQKRLLAYFAPIRPYKSY